MKYSLLVVFMVVILRWLMVLVLLPGALVLFFRPFDSGEDGNRRGWFRSRRGGGRAAILIVQVVRRLVSTL